MWIDNRKECSKVLWADNIRIKLYNDLQTLLLLVIADTDLWLL